jgi:hypothetical protein
VARAYSSREEAAQFLEEEHFVSKFAYLTDIFEKFSTVNTSMQGNDTNAIAVTDKVEALIGK